MNVVMKVGKGGVGSQYHSSKTWKTEEKKLMSIPFFKRYLISL